VPDVIRVHDRLPRNTNGKIDRARLPVVEFAGRGGRAASETERLVCDLFQEVLGVPGIGPDDNFFRLGGHSLSAARLINRLLSRTGKRVRMAEFFDAPTPAAVARMLDR
jgi:acyl carrier protein